MARRASASTGSVLAEDRPSGGFALGQLGLSFEDRGVKPDAVHSVTYGAVVEAGENSGLTRQSGGELTVEPLEPPVAAHPECGTPENGPHLRAGDLVVASRCVGVWAGVEEGEGAEAQK